MSEYNQIINNFNAAMEGAKKGKRAAGDALNSIPKNLVSPMTDALLNVNPVTAIPNITRQAVPAVIDAVGNVGNAINSNPGVANVLDNPGLNLLNFLPGVGPAATIINTGIKGSRAVSTMRGADGVQAKPKFADLRGSETPGSDTPAADNSAADKAFSDAAKFQAGTDTGSGNREVTRVAQTDNMDDNMKIWAAANPELAANLVKKVDERRMNNPEYTQVGYDQARKQADPSYDPNARSQNFGPVADGVEYGRNLDLQGTAGVGPMEDGALYADMLSGKEKPNAQSFVNKKIQEQVAGNATDTSEYEAPANMIGLTNDVVKAKMSELGGEEYLRQLDAGKFHGR